MCVYKSCPSCILPSGNQNFFKPLLKPKAEEIKEKRSDGLEMEEEVEMEASFPRREEENVKKYYDTNPSKARMKRNFGVRPIANCLWDRECIPTDIYSIISTDILHLIPHGALEYFYNNLEIILKRYKISDQELRELMERQSFEFVLFNSPSFKIVNNDAVLDPTRIFHLRTLDVSVGKENVKMKSADSMATWMHGSSIILGYGLHSALLNSNGNELHHYRIGMNLVILLLMELENTDIAVGKEWKSNVNAIVDGIILVFQDPHMYSGNGTEKMHRLRHIVNNYHLHGSFKTSNTAHYERCHSVFTKETFENVGRFGKESSKVAPPRVKMILEVYSIFISTFFKNPGLHSSSLSDANNILTIYMNRSSNTR